MSHSENSPTESPVAMSSTEPTTSLRKKERKAKTSPLPNKEETPPNRIYMMAAVVVFTAFCGAVVGEGVGAMVPGLASLGAFTATVAYEILMVRAEKESRVALADLPKTETLNQILETATLNAQALNFIVRHIQEASQQTPRR